MHAPVRMLYTGVVEERERERERERGGREREGEREGERERGGGGEWVVHVARDREGVIKLRMDTYKKKTMT